MLTDRKIVSLREGRHADGHNLYIHVRGGAFTWMPHKELASNARWHLIHGCIPKNVMSNLQFLRLPEFKMRTGLSKSEIHRRMEGGTFHAIILLGKRAVAWRSDEIKRWLAERIAEIPHTRPDTERGDYRH